MTKPTKTKLARKLRQTQSNAEAIFWREVRGRIVGGFKFRRQVPIDKFIADFVCESAKLIIELDGHQHADTKDADLARTETLETKGYRVIRFWNHDVYNNLDGVMIEVLAELELASNREL
ncbi:MAG: hypothetical protein COA91_10785 [Robiginitomaculum sp.]|nr:MAG: hypothetical protein COA91_10785 [Robiginitomaculum sp.]